MVLTKINGGLPEMGNIGMNRRQKFVEGKIREAFGKRDMDVDQMIQDLAREGRSTSVF